MASQACPAASTAPATFPLRLSPGLESYFLGIYYFNTDCTTYVGPYQ